MVDLVTYEFNAGKITPKEWFSNSYAEEVYELEHLCTDTKLLRDILNTK